MRKFEHYPVYINHPGRWEKVRQSQLETFKYQRDRHMVSWLTYTAKQLYEIMEDKNPAYEDRMFENTIYQALRLISSTRVGRLVLDSLDRNQKYWIVPLDDATLQTCDCGGAFTFPGRPVEGGGIRIYFHLNSMNRTTKNWVGHDDILLHELVHAYRIGRIGYEAVNSAKAMKGNDNLEEFLALQIQNLYLANRRATRFYLSYNTLRSVSKGTAYEEYARDGEVLAALRQLVETEPVASEASKWMHPPDSFNVFRDRNVLERMFLSNGGSLPAF